MGLALLLVLNLLFAGTPVFFKLASEELSPVTFVWLRHTIALLWVTPLAIAVGIPRLPLREFLRVAAAALSAFTGASLLQASAMQQASASAGAMLIAMEPILMILFAILFLHERLRPRLGLGLVLAFAGFLLLSWGEGAARFEGNSLYLLAVLAEAIYPMMIIPLLRHRHPLQIAFYCLLCSSLTLLPLQTGELVSTISAMSGKGWGAVLYLGIGCSGTAAVLWLYAMRRMQASTVAISWFLQPVWGNLLAMWILAETLTMHVYAGGALILSAVALLCGAGGHQSATASTQRVAPPYPAPTPRMTLVFPSHSTAWPPRSPRRHRSDVPWRSAQIAFHHPPRRHRPAHRTAA